MGPFRVETSFLRRFFTKAVPSPESVNLKKDAYMEWALRLAPQSETKIVVVENFRPVIYVMLISIVTLIIYFIYRSPVVIRKEALVVGTSHGGITELKVLLHLRNRSQDLIENLTVTDLVPGLGELVKENSIGTIMPSKVIKHDTKGTIAAGA